jgi:hypothetical protein
MRPQEQAVFDLFMAKGSATNAEVEAAIGLLVTNNHRRVIVNRARPYLAKNGRHVNAVYGWGYLVEPQRSGVHPKSDIPREARKLRATPRWDRYRRQYVGTL